MVATSPELRNNDPLEVEFLAIFRGLQLCMPMGLQRVVVESDALVAIEHIKAGATS